MDPTHTLLNFSKVPLTLAMICLILLMSAIMFRSLEWDWALVDNQCRVIALLAAVRTLMANCLECLETPVKGISNRKWIESYVNDTSESCCKSDNRVFFARKMSKYVKEWVIPFTASPTNPWDCWINKSMQHLRCFVTEHQDYWVPLLILNVCDKAKDNLTSEHGEEYNFKEGALKPPKNDKVENIYGMSIFDQRPFECLSFQ